MTMPDHVFYSWSAQGNLAPVPVTDAAGCWFWDGAGKRYLDLASQLIFANLGHRHPRLVAAVHDQAERLCTLAPQFANDTRSELARLIAQRAPGDLEQVFFTNGGAEANEHAVRMARIHTGRSKVLSAYRSYHGATTGAITLTGDPRRWPNEPGMPDVVHFFGPYPYREPDADPLAHLTDVLTLEGPHTVAAILLETIVGTNGVIVPPPGYLAGVRELCDRHGIVLICDEVMVGFGRVGEWFATDAFGLAPDLITFAKGVNSGYVPLGGVVISRRIARTFHDRPYPGGLTYSGHPLACAAGVASIHAIEDEGILEHVRALGTDVVGPSLHQLRERHPSVGDVRGMGLFWAVELVRDRQTREMLVPYQATGPDAEPMNRVVAAIKERGVWPFAHMNRIHIAPPLVVTEEEIKVGIDAIDEALDIADGYVR